MTLNISEINNLIDVISKVSTYDFSDYSEKSFRRRIEKVLDDHNMSITSLTEKLSSNPKFLENIIKEITVNTTEIFRDTKTWQILKDKVLKKYKDKEIINIWHVGSSTGQEVYSLIILLNELDLLDKARIIATDLNSDVIEVAKTGVYKFREIDEFIESYDAVMMSNDDDDNYKNVPYQQYVNINRRKNLIKLKPELLNKAEFYTHDIVQDGNIFDIKFDLIFCRNVLIYFNHKLQNKIIEFFYENISNGGALIIGRHEGMLGQISNKFKKTGSVYLKRK